MLSINRPLQDGCQNALLNSLFPQMQTDTTDPSESGTKLNSVFLTPSTEQVLGHTQVTCHNSWNMFLRAIFSQWRGVLVICRAPASMLWLLFSTVSIKSHRKCLNPSQELVSIWIQPIRSWGNLSCSLKRLQLKQAILLVAGLMVLCFL